MQVDRNVLVARAVYVKRHDTRLKANITLAAVTPVTEYAGFVFLCILKAKASTLQQL